LAVRTVVYVDALNFYYGSLKGSGWKWLNLQQVFERLLSHDHLVKVHYCTAMIQGPGWQRQQAYLDAMHKACPKVQVTFGNMKKRQRVCGVRTCNKPGAKFWHPEEKRTDVNLAVHMVDDAYQGLCDRMVLVTGDTDLVPPIQLIRGRFPQLDLRVYVPAAHKLRKEVHELAQHVHRLKMLPRPLLRQCLLPETVEHPDDRLIREPSEWAQLRT
jgi:hypothetical protein